MLELKLIVEEVKQFQKPFYIYIMYKPEGTPFYVGKGKVKTKDQRITYHEQEAKSNGNWQSQPHINMHKINTIKQIWEQGKQVLYSIDSWHDLEKDAYARERELIRSIGRRITGDGPLTNLTEGGEVETMVVSEETRQKISDSLKKYYKENPERLEQIKKQGKEWIEKNPEEAKKIFSEGGKKGVKHLIKWMQEHPEELKENGKKHSEFMLEWHENNKERTKEIAAKRNEKFRTPEHRQHMSEATKKYNIENPEKVKEIIAKRNEKFRTPEHRQHMSEALKKYNKENPEKAKEIAAKRNKKPETRQCMSEAARENPEASKKRQ